MSIFRLKTPVAAAVVLATGSGLAVAAAPAGAKVLPTDISDLPRGGAVAGGRAELTLSTTAASRLKAAGGRITATGGAKAKGRTLTFDPGDGSVVDTTTMRGTLELEGGLTVKGRKKTAKLRAITLEPGLERRVTAKLGSKLVELGSLKGGKARFSGQADGQLTGAKLSLSSSAAKRLNQATGGGFASGAFASVEAKVTGRELPLASGSATLTLDPTLLKTLTDGGYAISAEAPATATPTTVTIPLTGGAFDPAQRTGRLAFSGKITIGKAGTGIGLFDFRSAIGGGQNDLYASFNSVSAAPLATIDLSTTNVAVEGGRLSARGARLGLSKFATDVLKQQFGVVFPAGFAMGTVDIDGSLSGQ